MAENTNILWCDSTFNPWIGCTQVSPLGCAGCYAKAEWDDRRHRVVWGPGQARSRTKTWGDPVKWNQQQFFQCSGCGRRGTEKELAATDERGCDCHKHMEPVRRRVFCASLADVFDNEVPVQWRMDLFRLIADTPNLDWLVLTKRVGNVMKMCSGDSLMFDLLGERVWLGITVVNQEEADRDIPKLLSVPAAKRFLSLEPLLGNIDLSAIRRTNADGFMRPLDGRFNTIDWVIVGGETGPDARPMHPDWARSLRDQCRAARVSYVFKQHGEWREPLPDEEYDTSMGRAAKTPAFIISQDGSVHCFESDNIVNGKAVIRVGKKAAGRLLDGQMWDEVPT